MKKELISTALPTDFKAWLSRPPKVKKGARKRVRPVSDKRRLQGAIYRVRRLEFLREHRICEAGPRIPHHLPCDLASKDVHHSAGRTAGNYLDRSTWIAVCRPCHDWIHAHGKEARSLGLLS